MHGFTEVQGWVLLMLLGMFYARLPATTRLEKIVNQSGNCLAAVCLWNAVALLQTVSLLGWKFRVPTW